jgi:hypothetical protein
MYKKEYNSYCQCNQVLNVAFYVLKKNFFKFKNPFFPPALITSDFSRSNGEWTAEEDSAALPVTHDPIHKLISLQSDPSGNLQGAYFVAPGRFANPT